jgi:hypothetical protein
LAHVLIGEPVPTSPEHALMSEWWTYELSDFLLFSPGTYYRLFELYNRDVWPAQILALALGVAIVALRRRGRAISAIVAGLWLWVAWAYLLERYDTINWAARYFAVAFVLQALLLVWSGVMRNRLQLRPPADALGAAGLAIFLFALVGQPLIGPVFGREWAQAEIFGLAPDPTVVGTLGLVVAARQPLWALLVVPCIWCGISGAALWAMHSPDASVMPCAAVLALLLTGWKALRAPRDCLPPSADGEPRLPDPGSAR